jgi:hypothetical protein
MINFSKFRELYNIVSQIARYTSAKYKFEKNPELVNFLNNVKPFQEKKLRDLSEVYEPRIRKKTVDEGELKEEPRSPVTPTRSGSTAKKIDITPEQIDEYKRTMIEKYEQQQQESRNMLKLRQELAKEQSKPSEDDDVIINDGENTPLHTTIRIRESNNEPLRPRSLTEDEKKFMSAQAKGISLKVIKLTLG